MRSGISLLQKIHQTLPKDRIQTFYTEFERLVTQHLAPRAVTIFDPDDVGDPVTGDPIGDPVPVTGDPISIPVIGDPVTDNVGDPVTDNVDDPVTDNVDDPVAGDPVPVAGDPVPVTGDPVPVTGDPIGDLVPVTGDPVTGDPEIKPGKPLKSKPKPKKP